jgi:hypothetical protein
MRSLIFQSWGIKAIMDGTKTMTRRIINPQPEYPFQFYGINSVGRHFYFADKKELARLGKGYCFTPKIQIGETFYARETYWIDPVFKDDPLKGIYYKADPDFYKKEMIKWKSSMFMPEKYARLFLKCTDVKAERAQDISNEDAKKEGIAFIEHNKYAGQDYWGIKDDFNSYAPNAYTSFAFIWTSINGQKLWDDNPWCWAYTFELTRGITGRG